MSNESFENKDDLSEEVPQGEVAVTSGEEEVSRAEKVSSIFTIICCGFALIRLVYCLLIIQ